MRYSPLNQRHIGIVMVSSPGALRRVVPEGRKSRDCGPGRRTPEVQEGPEAVELPLGEEVLEGGLREAVADVTRALEDRRYEDHPLRLRPPPGGVPHRWGGTFEGVGGGRHRGTKKTRRKKHLI